LNLGVIDYTHNYTNQDGETSSKHGGRLFAECLNEKIQPECWSGPGINENIDIDEQYITASTFTMTLPFAYKLSMRRLIAVNKNFEKEKRECL